jgi:hypothetical protein
MAAQDFQLSKTAANRAASSAFAARLDFSKGAARLAIAVSLATRTGNLIADLPEQLAWEDFAFAMT